MNKESKFGSNCSPVLTELGDAQSNLSSPENKDLKLKPEELDESVQCQACRLIELRNTELKKKREKLKRALLEHVKLDHQDAMKPHFSELCKDDRVEHVHSSDEVQKNCKNPDVSISDRVKVSEKGQQMLIQPPQPRIKRLKGELAKSVGRKIDGCDWLIFHPDLNEQGMEAVKRPGPN